MKFGPDRALVLGAAIVVLLIGVAMFAAADEQLTDEARIARMWSDALCDARYDTLYELSAVEVDAETFTSWTRSYLESGRIPQPCITRVNLNLVRPMPVPDSLRASIDLIRMFSEVNFIGPGGATLTLPLWLYRQKDGAWRVWAGYFGATPENGAAVGETVALTDRSGLLIGMAQVLSPVQVYQGENRALFGVTMTLQTLTQPWEWHIPFLMIDGVRARPVEHLDQMPEEWRTEFASANGGSYLPQNLEQTIRFWFAFDGDAAGARDLTLAFTAQAPHTGTLKATYFTIPEDALAPITPFNPFRNVRPIEAAGRIAFAAEVDMTSFPGDRLYLECTRIIAVTAAGSWRHATDCGFPAANGQFFLPGDHLATTIYFDGYADLSQGDIVRLDYRRNEFVAAVRYLLWSTAP
ncbi:MAG: hypothetical protein L6Q98_16420 [Anaerolineae bacterium]|nr:hypothetical protein [Anaerolineae bacterium]NUQ04264.1 hypothetical protein [Anaerolineae bacterium]